MVVPGPQTEWLADVARRHRVHLSIGVTERSVVSMGALYNANLLFGPDGRLLNHRRKLVPTWAEKLTWANGVASELRPAPTALGRIGALICGENTNTLARYGLLAQGEQVHLATYPPAWPFQRPGAARGYDLTHAIEILSAAHAFEGKVFVVVASALLDEPAIELVAQDDAAVAEVLRYAPPPISLVIGPHGERCADSIEPKQAHDIIGNYQRPDLFTLQVDQRPQRPIELINGRDHREEPSAHASNAHQPTSAKELS
jgi:nitrilase/aliphatic nitrilase